MWDTKEHRVNFVELKKNPLVFPNILQRILSKKMEVNCVICNKEVDMGKQAYLSHRCGHYSHAGCHDPNDKALKCAQCFPDSTAAKNRVEIKEPGLASGLDWVKTKPSQASSWSQALKKVRDWNKRDAIDMNNPFTLLSMKKDIPWMIQYKQFGLAHMYDCGVTLEDFLKYGYSIDDLCAYEDIGKKGASRGLEALRVLGLSPDLLCDYPELLPMKKMRDQFQLTSLKICSPKTGGGLYFDPVVGLCTDKTDDWSIDNVIQLGLTFDDLVSYAGLRLKAHWDDLDVTREQMKKLKCKREDIETLITVNEDEEEERREVPRVKKEPKIVVRGPRTKVVRKYVKE